jgi:hypothetical protein
VSAAHAPRRPAVFTVVAYAFGLVVTLFTGLLAVHWLDRWNQAWRSDFADFYAAGTLVRHGHLAQAYSLKALGPIEKALAAGRPGIHLPFPYPPQVAVVFGILARLPLYEASVIWTVVALIAYVAAAYLALRRIPGKLRPLGVILLLGCLPLVISLAQGQMGAIGALGLTLTLEALYPAKLGQTPNHRMLAGGTILLLMKPELAVVPILLIMARRRHKEYASAGIALVVSAIPGLVAGGLGMYVAFAGQLWRAAHWATQYDWGPSSSYSLFAVVHQFIGFGSVATSIGILGSIAVVVVVVCSKLELEHAWLVIAAAVALVADHIQYHDLVLLYPAAVVALPTRFRWIALCIIASPWVDPTVYSLTGIHAVVLACLAAVGVIVRQPKLTAVEIETGDQVPRPSALSAAA